MTTSMTGRSADRGRSGRRTATVLLLTVGVIAVVVAIASGTRAPTTVSEPDVDPTPTTGSFPNAGTTGVPDGVALEPSGSVTVTQDGTVIDGLEITGTVVVKADDVVIRNSLIRNTGAFAIRLAGGRNLLVEDTEIDGQGRGNAAIVFGGYTLRRVHIHHVTEGPRIAGGRVTIEDSLIHQLVQKGDNHTDAVQIVGGRDIVIRRNTIVADNPDDGTYGNAAVQFGEEDGEVTDCLVEGNLLSGGNYTVNGGGGRTDGAACVFRENRIEDTARYGVQANLGPDASWDSSNVWRETGEPAR